MEILVVDNYDSFTFNLVHAFAAAGATVTVRRNDALTYAEALRMAPVGIVLSPGPGHPAVARDLGVCAELIQGDHAIPMLGVCLGMQGMAHCTGGDVVRAPRPVHGEAGTIGLTPHPLFAGLPPTIQAGRYHSLVVQGSTLPQEWLAIAHSPDGLLMAMAHRSLPRVGTQFHPESILTPDGPRIVHNFMAMCR